MWQWLKKFSLRFVVRPPAQRVKPTRAKTTDRAAGGKRHHKLTLVTGQELDAETYELVRMDGNVERRGEPAESIDGGAGQVFRATNKLGLSFAIKVLNPAEGLIADDSGVFHETFQREIKLLARITHTRLAKIIDVGIVSDDDDREVPYYVMDFVDGTPFQDFLEREKLSGRDFLALIDQVLEGVEYLHVRWIMHCDLKGANILVNSPFDGQAQATIVDLGVAKVVKKQEGDRNDPAEDGLKNSEVNPDSGDEHAEDKEYEEKTYFVSSESITREEWRPYLNTRILRTTLENELFPYHDLYGLGVLVDKALEIDSLKKRLGEELGETGLRALEQLVAHLLKSSAEEPHYKSVSQLREDWRKLHPRHLAPVGIPELAIGAQAKTSIATPQGRVSLTDRTLAVVNHPAMQRLRLVPQLELVSLVYPGATHTRLLHSLSTFDMTRRCVLHLLRDPAFRLMANSEEIEAALLTALCHDIGHYPLSHMFEDFAQEERREGNVPDDRRTPSDDDLFYAFLHPESLSGGPFAHFAEVISAASAGHPTDRAIFHERVFAPGGFSDKVQEALHTVESCKSSSAKILRGLISSPVDADKLAYLSDDSAMTGVRYGLGIDVDAFLSSLRTPSPFDLERLAASEKPIVALSDKGLPAAESVILSRYWMLKRVYWHHTNRAAITMVKYVIAELRRKKALDMSQYIEETLFSTIQEALALLSKRFDETFPEQTNPLIGLQNGDRWLYKRILTFAKGDADEESKHLFGALAYKRSEETGEITNLAREALREAAGRDIREGEVLLDIPVKERELSGSEVLVYPHRDPSRGREVDEVSPLIKSHGEEFDQHVKKCRIFVHPQLFEDLGDELVQGRKSLEGVLYEKFA
ncbi:MAG TPA: protein kinase [Solirubrobacterales bacterium]|nr:protein kinase [Solirubrobacterales bacterium]